MQMQSVLVFTLPSPQSHVRILRRRSMADAASKHQRLLPLLPDEISIRCIARLPLSSHPALALVSRSWRSLLLSHSFSAVRSDLGATEPILLINVRTPSNQSLWFLLLDRRRFVPLESQPIPTFGTSCAALGSSLYVIGGSNRGIPSTALQVFDARTNRWALGPPMSAAREFSAAAFIDGRIYVFGGCHPSSDSWAEVFDVSSKWSPILSPAEIRHKLMRGSAVLDGRFLAMADQGGVTFDPRDKEEAVWGPVPAVLDLGWKGRAAVVDGVLYSFDSLWKIRGYDPARDEWKELEGLGRELPKFFYGTLLVNFGGILCLVWKKRGRGWARERVHGKMMEIECAGIEVSRTSAGGLCGSIGWWESAVLAVPKGSSITHCVALEV